MMLLAMLCSDLCIYVFISMIYSWILVLTRLYAWFHVLPCLCAKFLHVYMYVSMPICLDLSFHMPMCLDLSSLHALCYLPCTCVLHVMFMCLGLDLVCHVMYYCSLFVPFIAFSCVLAYWFEPDLDPMVFAIVLTPWPTSKGLDHPFCMSMLACLLLCFMLVLASLVLGFTTLDALSGFVVMRLHLTPMRPCLDITIWEASP